MAKNIAFVPTQPYKEVYGAGTPQPPKYMPTYYEWLFKQGEIIFRAMAVAGGGYTLYTVPEGHTFFITSITLSANLSVAAAFGVTASIYKSTSIKYLAALYFRAVQTQNMSQSYNFPIICFEKEAIYVYSNDPNLDAFGTFYGFLVKNSVIPANF